MFRYAYCNIWLLWMILCIYSFHLVMGQLIYTFERCKSDCFLYWWPPTSPDHLPGYMECLDFCKIYEGIRSSLE